MSAPVNVEFDPVVKPDSPTGERDSMLSETNAAPFDPENPELTETPMPVLEPEASLLQRGAFYIQLAKYYREQKLKSLRPWKEFADREEFSIPGKLEALSRVSDNIQYFNANYWFLVSLMSVYILITNIWFMVGMSLCGATYYWVKMKAQAKEPIMIGASTELTTTQSYFGLFLLSLFTFYITDGSSTVFWLVTCAAVVVLGHATCRKPIAAGQNVNPAFTFA